MSEVACCAPRQWSDGNRDLSRSYGSGPSVSRHSRGSPRRRPYTRDGCPIGQNNVHEYPVRGSLHRPLRARKERREHRGIGAVLEEYLFGWVTRGEVG